MPLPWLGVFKYINQCHTALAGGIQMIKSVSLHCLLDKLWNEITWHTHTRTQPFIVKDLVLFLLKSDVFMLNVSENERVMMPVSRSCASLSPQHWAPGCVEPTLDTGAGASHGLTSRWRRDGGGRHQWCDILRPLWYVTVSHSLTGDVMCGLLKV